jgi:2-polyprenyl-3-methyl-5-hydroxy-6-metoxy-1,4-benzoquinol methylase
MPTQRIEREKEFHNRLASSQFGSRRLINRLSSSFYSKEEGSPIWAPVWSKIDVRGKRVLDYGSGDGGFSFVLAQRGALVEGIDISDALVHLAKERAPETSPCPRFSVRDAHDTGFPEASFDYVFGNGILHHMELARAYREVARVLKPGGKAFFMEPIAHHPLAVLLRKTTPAARSVHEMPLTLEQVHMARHFFSEFRYTEHYVTAVLAAPMHLASPAAATWAIRQLDRLDRVMIRKFPSIGRYAWQGMLELGNL